MENKCENCIHNDVCDHNKYGWENCNNYKDKSLCVELPCKVGDTVYWYNMGGEIVEAKIKMVGFAVRHSKGFEYDVPFDVFGKTVFLTKEEAEQKINEINNTK
jgi:hypothetical protein